MTGIAKIFAEKQINDEAWNLLLQCHLCVLLSTLCCTMMCKQTPVFTISLNKVQYSHIAVRHQNILTWHYWLSSSFSKFTQSKNLKMCKKDECLHLVPIHDALLDELQYTLNTFWTKTFMTCTLLLWSWLIYSQHHSYNIISWLWIRWGM